MTISCNCDFDLDYDDYDWWWEGHSKIKIMGHFNKRKRCCSCGELINPGEDVFKFYRFRKPKSIIEESIHGDEVPLAPDWTCEICSGLITSVEDLGMCYSLNDPIKDQIAEYREAEVEYKKHIKNNPKDDSAVIEDFFC